MGEEFKEFSHKEKPKSEWRERRWPALQKFKQIEESQKAAIDYAKEYASKIPSTAPEDIEALKEVEKFLQNWNEEARKQAETNEKWGKESLSYLHFPLPELEVGEEKTLGGKLTNVETQIELFELFLEKGRVPPELSDIIEKKIIVPLGGRRKHLKFEKEKEKKKEKSKLE